MKGTYDGAISSSNGAVTVHTSDQSGNAAFPDQCWPLVDGKIKVLVMLSPGLNKIVFQLGSGSASGVEISVNYVPLLQCPPLHLAIMVASDSPLIIDCPPAKHGGK